MGRANEPPHLLLDGDVLLGGQLVAVLWPISQNLQGMPLQGTLGLVEGYTP